MIRAIIADDHAVVRSGLQFAFDLHSNIQIVHECANGNELISYIQKNDCDVVILDVLMPGKDAIDVLKDLKLLKPKIPVVIFTMNTEENLQMRMFKNGASAFIGKEEGLDVLISAINRIVKGEKYYSEQQLKMFAKHFDELSSKSTASLEELSDREFQLLTMLAYGYTKSEIAEKLNLSKHTVSNHRNSILKKLRLRNNAELTKYAIDNNLIK